jgi:hypothetical protein
MVHKTWVLVINLLPAFLIKKILKIIIKRWD